MSQKPEFVAAGAFVASVQYRALHERRRATKSDAVAGIEGRTSPSEPLFAPATASGTDDANAAFLKIARAM